MNWSLPSCRQEWATGRPKRNCSGGWRARDRRRKAKTIERLPSFLFDTTNPFWYFWLLGKNQPFQKSLWDDSKWKPKQCNIAEFARKPTMHIKDAKNHILHLLLSVVTGAFWLVVWLLIWLKTKKVTVHCVWQRLNLRRNTSVTFSTSDEMHKWTALQLNGSGVTYRQKFRPWCWTMPKDQLYR